MELSLSAANVQERFHSLTQLWLDALLRERIAGGRTATNMFEANHTRPLFS
jgi:hypothetical protein